MDDARNIDAAASSETRAGHLKASTFRADIGALRALAVILVVLFHFGVSLVRGGFVGVDVFFAISGYLMTRIIVGGLEGVMYFFQPSL